MLAPKSQAWDVIDGQWKPQKGPASVAERLRPLSHVSVRDQIVATAFMLLFADAVETRQGDPRGSATDARSRRMVSYGHRLLCDKEEDGLRFRWGNSVVYRRYFQDYQNFVSRPEEIVGEIFGQSTNWAIIQADLSQFYDRVRPSVLHHKIRRLFDRAAEAPLLAKFESFFSWSWHPTDLSEALAYGAHAEPPIPGFDSIALPQGLVASGFFANAVLIDFDDAVTQGFDQWFDGGTWQLVDFSRYVDDIRVVVRIGDNAINAPEEEIKGRVVQYLTGILEQHSAGLTLNGAKCSIVLGRDSAAGSIAVSATMKRINHNASGTMDLVLGAETVDLVENLFLSREDGMLGLGESHRDSFFTATPDVRPETVARFLANRFKRTFRSLRPLCEDSPTSSDESLLPALSRSELDQKAAYFSRKLIEKWARDPSNVRLLRVALDVRPDPNTLTLVLGFLKQYVGPGKRRKAPRRVAFYCAAELLKAGATETGLVFDADQLPSDVDAKRYQEQLATFAEEIVSRPNAYPWYLEQQAYLFLACVGRYQNRRIYSSTNASLKDYLRLHHTMAGRAGNLRREDVVPYSLLQRRQDGVEAAARTFVFHFFDSGSPTQRRLLLRVLQEDAELSLAIYNELPAEEKETWKHLFLAYGVIASNGFPESIDAMPSGETSFPFLSVAHSELNPFRQEYAALILARSLLAPLADRANETVCPSRLKVRAKNWRALLPDRYPIAKDSVSVEFESVHEDDRRFILPPWAGNDQNPAWKYQLGQILRVLLTGQPDFTVSAPSTKRDLSAVRYAPYTSSWLRRRYGLFNGRGAFGPPWLPISSWFGSLLSRLLECPGFARYDFDFRLADGFDLVALTHLLDERIHRLEQLYGRASYTPLLPARVPKSFMRPPPDTRTDEAELYSMRVGVVQTVIPRSSDFEGDSELKLAPTRQLHRRHLSSVLGAVHRMLQVRETHRSGGGGIELLVFPELSIHPDDIWTHVVPFVRQHRCIVCAGIVFHRSGANANLVNSAYWTIPVRTPYGGLTVERIEQGKWNLTKEEVNLGIVPFVQPSGYWK